MSCQNATPGLNKGSQPRPENLEETSHGATAKEDASTVLLESIGLPAVFVIESVGADRMTFFFD